MRVMDQVAGEDWTLYNGDSAEALRGIPDHSIGHAVFSPPFSSLYTYTPSTRDLGNVRSRGEFFEHHAFVRDELARVMMPGRIVAAHTAELQEYGTRDGRRGRYDFPGDYIRHMKDGGFAYCGRISIDKNPQALRDGTPVLTPFGWQAIETLRVGQAVTGSNGRPTRVTGVYPQGVRPLYRVTFSDGVSVEADAQHRWNVRTLGCRKHGDDGWRVMTTAELMATGLNTPNGRRRFEVPIVSPVEYGRIESLPLDPYILGALLGDGNVSQRSTVAITTQHEIVEECARLSGTAWRKLPKSDQGNGTVATYHASGSAWHRNDILSALRELGVQGTRAWEKRIPPRYLRASIHARRALLRGLLDTDGGITQHGGVRFHTTSEPLADDVTELVQSLGGLARRRIETVRRYVHNGEARNGRPLHEVVIALNGDWCPFMLPSKVKGWRGEIRRQPHREIVSIEPCGEAPATCIAVDAIDSLYVTQHHVVTHNTQAIRNHPQELLFATLRKDASKLVPALADYLLVFRAPGENAVPIPHPIDEETWITWAHPVWPYEAPADIDTALLASWIDLDPIWRDIREMDILPAAGSKENDDERHLCPLQLPVIERCVQLWSKPGEIVLSPFAGIGSEGVATIRCGRKFVGCELKPSYFQVATRFLREAERASDAPDLFSLLDEAV